MLQLTAFALQQQGKQNKQHHERDHGNLTVNHLLKNGQTCWIQSIYYRILRYSNRADSYY